MGKPSHIPENLILPLVKLWETGMTADKLVIWLKETHDIDASIRSVNNRIKKIKDIEIQAKRDAIAKRASEQAMDYLAIMDKDILKLDKLTDKLLASDDDSKHMLAKQLLEIKLKNIDKQMNLTGMDKPEKEDTTEEVIIETLLSKLPSN